MKEYYFKKYTLLLFQLFENGTSAVYFVPG